MLMPEKPRSNERSKQASERQEPPGKKNDSTPATEVAVPLEPHWAALVDGATD
jgi:hypothetical protein